MNPLDFSGKRVLITQATDFMGPVLLDVFRELGATVFADGGSLEVGDRPAALIAEAGNIDILIANLGVPAPATPAADVGEDEWRHAFSHMVDPLPRLVRAVLPQMRARGSGKIILIGSASALRGIKRASTYSAARGAQLAYIQAVGVEVAQPHHVVKRLGEPKAAPAQLGAQAVRHLLELRLADVGLLRRLVHVNKRKGHVVKPQRHAHATL